MQQSGFVQLEDKKVDKHSDSASSDDKSCGGKCLLFFRNIRYYLPDILLVFSIPIMLLFVCSVYSYLNYTPFNQVATGLVVVVSAYWVLSFIILALYRSSKPKEDTFHSKKLHWMLLIIMNIMTFVAMMVMVTFMFPETFYPTSNYSFRRIGSVTDTTASFFIRETNTKLLSTTQNNQVYVQIRKQGESDWTLTSTTLTISSANDYAGYASINGLTSSTTYEYIWNVDNSAASSNKQISSFKTFTAAGAPTKFRFAYGSCYTNGFPYNRKGSSFDHVIQTYKPDFFAFIGDFIYADHPVFRGTGVVKYWELYRQTLSTLISAIKDLPMFYVFDDHELDDNYDEGDKSVMYDNAINKAWKTYLGGGNPQTTSNYYYNTDIGDVAIYFVDTRSFRNLNADKEGASKSILGAEQKQHLKNWLLAKNSTSSVKFIFSSVGLTTDFTESGDSWAGFMTERNEVLNFIRDNNIKNVYFLTGDTHYPYMAELGGVNKTGVYEFSASPVGSFAFFDPAYLSKPVESLWVVEEMGSDSGYAAMFGIIDVDTTGAKPTVTVSVYDARKQKVLRSITV